jgi:hypothetical protein
MEGVGASVQKIVRRGDRIQQLEFEELRAAQDAPAASAALAARA